MQQVTLLISYCLSIVESHSNWPHVQILTDSMAKVCVKGLHRQYTQANSSNSSSLCDQDRMMICEPRQKSLNSLVSKCFQGSSISGQLYQEKGTHSVFRKTSRSPNLITDLSVRVFASTTAISERNHRPLPWFINSAKKCFMLLVTLSNVF